MNKAGCSKRAGCKASDDPATDAGSCPPQELPHSLRSQGAKSPPPQMGLFQRPANILDIDHGRMVHNALDFMK